MKSFIIELLSGSAFLLFWLVFLLGLRFAWITYSEGVTTLYLPWFMKHRFYKTTGMGRKSRTGSNSKRKRNYRVRMEPKILHLNRGLIRIGFEDNEAELERLDIINSLISKRA